MTKHFSFPVDEYRRRVRSVQNEMAPLDLDALLVHNFASICYLTGFESIAPHKYYMVVVPREGDPELLCQDFEVHNTLTSAWVDRISTYGLKDDPAAATIELLGERGLENKRLGMVANDLQTSIYLHLRENLHAATFVEAAGVVEKVKVVKSQAEIEVFRRAAALSSAGMRAAIAAAEEGRTDNDVALAAYEAIIGGGGEYMCYAPIVTVGGRSGIPHTTHRRTTIRRGDCVFMEFGACIHRYSAPIMRTVVTGEPSEEIRRSADACRIAVESLIQHLRPGITGNSVWELARKSWPNVPADRVWLGGYAYSIGLGFPPEWNDTPLIVWEGENTVLAPGMVFHATSSLRKVGEFGTTVGETVVLTENGCEVLTDVPRELVVK